MFGKSAGGLNTIMLSQFGVIPIKAAGNLAGSIDIFTDMRIMGSWDLSNNPFLHRIGLTDADITTPGNSSTDIEYLQDNSDKIIGYNPFWFNSSGLSEEDRKTLIQRIMVDGINTPTIESDETYQNIVDKITVHLRIPMKWWHAVDDVNVPIATTRAYQRAVRRGGGIFYIREFPAGCGAHHAVDNDPSAPTTEYTHDNGVTVTLPVAYAEMLDWFKMWW